MRFYDVFLVFILSVPMWLVCAYLGRKAMRWYWSFYKDDKGNWIVK